jgi:hypothetical protein
MKVENPVTSTGGVPLACGTIIGGEAQLEHEHRDVLTRHRTVSAPNGPEDESHGHADEYSGANLALRGL